MKKTKNLCAVLIVLAIGVALVICVGYSAGRGFLPVITEDGIVPEPTELLVSEKEIASRLAVGSGTYSNPDFDLAGEKFTHIDNNYLSLYINNATGAYAVKASVDELDATQQLSYAVFKIGEDYLLFGSDSGATNRPIINENANGDPVVTTVWTYNDYVFTQTQTIVKDESEVKSYAVYTVYSMVNATDNEVEVTPYTMLDVEFGINRDETMDYSGMGGLATDPKFFYYYNGFREDVYSPTELTSEKLSQANRLSSQTYPQNDYFVLNTEHIHTFQAYPASDDYCHWKNSTCGHDVKGDCAPHDYEGKTWEYWAETEETGIVYRCICNGCNYGEYCYSSTGHALSEEALMASYQSDEYGHWHEGNCIYCGKDKADYTAHTLEYEIITAATVENEGSRRCTCTVCGYEASEVIPRLNAVTTPTKIVLGEYTKLATDYDFNESVIGFIEEGSDPIEYENFYNPVMQLFYPAATVASRAETATPIFSSLQGKSFLKNKNYPEGSVVAPDIIYDTPEDKKNLELKNDGNQLWYGNFAFAYQWQLDAAKGVGIASIYSTYDGEVQETVPYGVQTTYMDYTIFGSNSYWASSMYESVESDVIEGRFDHNHMYVPHSYEVAMNPDYNQSKYKIHVVTGELHKIEISSNEDGRTLVPVAIAFCTCNDIEDGRCHERGHLIEIPADTLYNGEYYAPEGSTVLFAYTDSDNVSTGNGVREVRLKSNGENNPLAPSYIYTETDSSPLINAAQYFSFTMPTNDVELEVAFEGNPDEISYRITNNSPMITVNLSSSVKDASVMMYVDFLDLYNSMAPTDNSTMKKSIETRTKDFVVNVSTVNGQQIPVNINGNDYNSFSIPSEVFLSEDSKVYINGRTKLVAYFTMPASGVILSVQIIDRKSYSLTAVSNNEIQIEAYRFVNYQKYYTSDADELVTVKVSLRNKKNSYIYERDLDEKAKVLLNGQPAVKVGKTMIFSGEGYITFETRMPASNAVVSIDTSELVYQKKYNIKCSVVNSKDIVYKSNKSPLHYIIYNHSSLPESINFIDISPSVAASPEFLGIKFNDDEMLSVSTLLSNGSDDENLIYPYLIQETSAYSNRKTYVLIFKMPSEDLEITFVSDQMKDIALDSCFHNATYYEDLSKGFFTLIGDFFPDEYNNTQALAYAKGEISGNNFSGYGVSIKQVVSGRNKITGRIETLSTSTYNMPNTAEVPSGTDPYLELYGVSVQGKNDLIKIVLKDWTAPVIPSEYSFTDDIRYEVCIFDKGNRTNVSTNYCGVTTNPTYSEAISTALAVVQDTRYPVAIGGGKKQFAIYTIAAPTMEKLNHYLAGFDNYNVIFSISGSFTRSWTAAYDLFTFNTNQAVYMNGLISSYVPEDGSIEFKSFRKFDSELAVEITSKNCDMSVPGYTFYRPNIPTAGYSVKMERAINYIKTDVPIDYRSSENSIGFNISVPGFVAYLNKAIVTNNEITFGGRLAIAEPFTLAEIDIKRLTFSLEDGDFSIKGVEAYGKAGLSELPVSFGVTGDAEAYINSFTGEYMFDLSLDLYFFSTEARLSLRPLNNGLVFPDEVYFAVEADPGIVITPMTPVVSLNGGGGGVSGIVDSFNGEFEGGIPPIEIEFFGSASIIEVISGSIGARIGVGSMFIFGEDLAVLDQEIISSMELGLALTYGTKEINGVEYKGYELAGSGSIELEVIPEMAFFVVAGEVSLGVMVGQKVTDESKYILSLGFNGSLKGAIQVPRTGIMGPVEIASGRVYLSLNANVHFDSSRDPKNVLAGASQGGMIGAAAQFMCWEVRVEYVFGGEPSASINFLSATPLERTNGIRSLASSQKLYNDDGSLKGVVTYGSNTFLVSESRDSDVHSIVQLSSSAKSIGNVNTPTVTSTSEYSKTHSISIPASTDIKNYAFVLSENVGIRTENPFDFIKGLSVVKPDNTSYPINVIPYSTIYTEEQMKDPSYNAIYTVDDEGSRTWYLSLSGESGSWEINTINDCKLSIVYIAALPHLESAEKEDDTIDFTTINTNNSEYVVRAYLTKKETGEMGVYVSECDVSEGSGSITLNVTDVSLQSGDYLVKLGLYRRGSTENDSDELMDVWLFENLYSYDNPRAPLAVTSVEISDVGNGKLKIDWVEPDETEVAPARQIKGYRLMLYEVIYNEDGSGNVVGYNDTEYVYQFRKGTTTFTAGGIKTDLAYAAGISPYTEMSAETITDPIIISIYGEEKLSDALFLRTPENLFADFYCDKGYVASSTGNRVEMIIGAEARLSIYATPTATMILEKETSAYDGTYEVVTYNTEDEGNYYVDISSTNPVYYRITVSNSNGDNKVYYCNIKVDVAAPTLLLDNTKAYISEKIYTISGYTDSGVYVSDNLGGSVTADNTGKFTIVGTLSAEQLTEIEDNLSASTPVYLAVSVNDRVGNYRKDTAVFAKRILYVNGENLIDNGNLTATNTFKKVVGESYAEYNPKTNILTLNGMTLCGAYSGAAIYSDADLDINLENESKISANIAYTAGIRTLGNLTISGSGSLKVDATSPIKCPFIVVDGDLVVNGATLDAGVTKDAEAEAFIAIQVKGSFDMFSGKLKASGSIGNSYVLNASPINIYGGEIEFTNVYGGLLSGKKDESYVGRITIVDVILSISTTDLPALLASQSNTTSRGSNPAETLITINGKLVLSATNADIVNFGEQTIDDTYYIDYTSIAAPASLSQDGSWHNVRGAANAVSVADTHHYSTEYSYDDDYHWQTCTDEGCSVAKYGDHVLGELLHDADTHYRLCSVCNGRIDEEAHDFVQTSVVAPTCEEDGYTLFTCSVCGVTEERSPVAKLGHAYGDHVSLNDGTHKQICSNDNTHILITDCSYENDVIAPTCEEGGYTLHTCTKCGYSFRDTVTEALGHAYGEFAPDGTGKHVKVCSHDNTHRIIEDCSIGTLIAEVPATCTENGTKAHYHCSVCNANYDADMHLLTDITILALGHAYGEFAPDGTGKHVKVCSHDNTHIVSEDCSVGTLIAEIPATCTEDGTKAHYHCSVCNANYDADMHLLSDITIPALGHAYGEFAPDGTGKHVKVCSHDNTHIVSEDCSVGTLIAEIPATCTEDGTKAHYHCSVCNANYDADMHLLTDLTITALGHDFVKTSTVAPSFTKRTDGYELWTCTHDSTHIQHRNTVEWITLIEISGDDDADFSSYVAGTALAPPVDKAGYLFGGWYKDAECTQPITVLDEETLNSGIKLYAKWEVAPEKEKSSVGLIVGLSVGGVVLVGVVVFLIIFLRSKKKSTPTASKGKNDKAMTPSSDETKEPK